MRGTCALASRRISSVITAPGAMRAVPEVTMKGLLVTYTFVNPIIAVGLGYGCRAAELIS
jgi:hypothetical protein